MRNGFTLIELSIVLVIVGLLTGGILVGQSLIESAQVNRFVSDFRQYDVAITQFDNRYRVLPGDAPYFTPAGAPNNILSSGDVDGDGSPDVVSCNGIFSNLESSSFWAHLSQAKMLSVNYESRQRTSCGGSENSPLESFNPVAEISGLDVSLIPRKSSSSRNLRLTLTVPSRAGLSMINKMGGQPQDFSANQVGLTYQVNSSSEIDCLAEDFLAGTGNGDGLGHDCTGDSARLSLEYFINP